MVLKNICYSKAKTKKIENNKTYLNETMFKNQERQKCMS